MNGCGIMNKMGVHTMWADTGREREHEVNDAMR